MTMTRYTFRLEHADGREWTREELNEFIQSERERQGLLTIGYGLHGVAVGGAVGGGSVFQSVFVLDKGRKWHRLEDDVVVVWEMDEPTSDWPEPAPEPVIRIGPKRPKTIRERVNPVGLAFHSRGRLIEEVWA